MTSRVTRLLVLSVLAVATLGVTSARACDGKSKSKANATSASAASCAATADAAACAARSADPGCCAAPGACATAAKATAAKPATKPAKTAKTTKSARQATTASRPAAPAVAGMRAAIDPETGTFTSLPVPVERLDDQLVERNVVLTQVPIPGGGYTMDLQGTLQDYFILQLDAQGGRHFGCARDPRILLQRTPKPTAPAQPLE